VADADDTLSQSAEAPGPWRRFFAPGLVIVLGVILVLGAFGLVSHYEDKWQQDDFRAIARGPGLALKRQTEDAVEVLLSVGQFFVASKQILPADFRAFTAAPLDDHPEIYSVAWMPRIEDSAREAFERNERVTIRDVVAAERTAPAITRPEYFPVAYVEPFSFNRPLLGLDHSSLPHRWHAMSRARDSGLPVGTGRQGLDFAPGNTAACLIFLPVYRPEIPIETVAARRTNLLGFAAITLNVERLFDLVVPQSRSARAIDLQLLIEVPGAPPELLHTTTPNLEPWTDIEFLQDETRFDLAGCHWTILARPTEVYLNAAIGNRGGC
jgi:CHASE1-domain containing sensor protein